jgi:beta-mannosidase
MFAGVTAFLGLFAVAAVTSSKTIIDLGDERWILQNPSLNISVPGSVPSHAHLDLLKNKIIDEPTYGTQLMCLRM